MVSGVLFGLGPEASALESLEFAPTGVGDPLEIASSLRASIA